MSKQVASCARCRSARRVAARYCHRCGRDHLDPTPLADRHRVREERPSAFVVRPTERVRSLNPVTTLLPRSNGAATRAYQWAMGIGLAVPLLGVVVGSLAFALVAAALAVPIVFTLHLYDVDEWDGRPVPVVLGCIVVAGGLGAAATGVIDHALLDPADKIGLGRLTSDAVVTHEVVAHGVVAPLVAVVLALAVPLVLATRPRFDDMIDRLTLGAVSGAAYAAGATLTTHRGLLHTRGRGGDVELWLAIVANAAIVKPLVHATAIAIAAAGFSGIGPGGGGPGRRCGTGVALAASAMVAYATGVGVGGEIDGPAGAAIGLGWGVLVAAALIVVLRTRVHHGVLEAALDAARGRPSRHEARGEAHCGECDRPLAPLALFCSACGTSVRATSRRRAHENAAAVAR